MKESIVLDDLDRRILRALQRDGSLSHSDLAALVGSTPPSCWRRVRRMEEAGVLAGTVRLVDRNAIGQGVDIICHVRIRGYEVERIQAFETFARSEPRILCCYSMSGEWDYLIRMVARSVRDYEHFLMDVLLKHPSVAGASSHFALKVVKETTALPIADARSAGTS